MKSLAYLIVEAEQTNAIFDAVREAVAPFKPLKIELMMDDQEWQFPTARIMMLFAPNKWVEFRHQIRWFAHPTSTHVTNIASAVRKQFRNRTLPVDDHIVLGED